MSKILSSAGTAKESSVLLMGDVQTAGKKFASSAAARILPPVWMDANGRARMSVVTVNKF